MSLMVRYKRDGRRQARSLEAGRDELSDDTLTYMGIAVQGSA